MFYFVPISIDLNRKFEMSSPIICVFSLKNNVKVPFYFENKDFFATKIEHVIRKLFDLNKKFNTNPSTLILRLSKDSPIFTYLSDDEQNIVKKTIVLLKLNIILTIIFHLS